MSVFKSSVSVGVAVASYQTQSMSVGPLVRRHILHNTNGLPIISQNKEHVQIARVHQCTTSLCVGFETVTLRA